MWQPGIKKTLGVHTVIVLSTAFWYCMPSGGQEHQHGTCPDLEGHLDLLKESEKYIEDSSLHGFRTHNLPLYSEVGRVVSDTAGPVREYNYLTAPISNAEDLISAKSEAAKLQKLGQKNIAISIQTRINEASKRLFGEQLTEQKFECISVAEQLRKRAWRCQGNSLPMAIKLYSRVVSVYKKEVGDRPKTAASLGELASAQALNGAIEDAKRSFASAYAIYKKFPSYKDDERASFLEKYADFMGQQNSPQLALTLYSEASSIRRESPHSEKIPWEYKPQLKSPTPKFPSKRS